MPGMRMRMFPIDDMINVIGGALIDSNGFHKSSTTDVPLIYLNANPKVQIVLDQIEIAAGKITEPKTAISPEHGFMAVLKIQKVIEWHFIPSIKNFLKILL